MTAKNDLNEKGLEAFRCSNCTTLFVDVIDAPFVTCYYCYKVLNNPLLTKEIEHSEVELDSKSEGYTNE